MRETFGEVAAAQRAASGSTMRKNTCAALFALLACAPAKAADRLAWPPTLPVYDHIVIVVEENKDVDQVFGTLAGSCAGIMAVMHSKNCRAVWIASRALSGDTLAPGPVS